jgi:hypothetical protein
MMAHLLNVIVLRVLRCLERRPTISGPVSQVTIEEPLDIRAPQVGCLVEDAVAVIVVHADGSVDVASCGLPSLASSPAST